MADEAILRQAWSFYRQGRFASAIDSLESKVFQFREDPEFYRILGLCCLRLGDWKGGETYLERSRQLEPSVHRDTLSGLMVVAARKQELGAAAQWGLALLDRFPEDKTGKRALAQLRVAVASNKPIETAVLQKWLPPFRKTNPIVRYWLVRVVAAVAVASGLAAGVWFGISLVHFTADNGKTRQGPATTSLPEAASDVLLPGTGFALTLTPEEIRQSWSNAQKAFQSYHDSRARYEVNRLLLSNASSLVKERARGLLPYLHDPDFSRPDDTSTFAEVRTAPTLYEGCTVRWAGVITNVNLGEKKITFDLLLGYQNGQVVEGVVPVELSFPALLKNSQAVEVLGRIALRANHWYLEGTSLRDLGYRTP